MNDPDEYRRKTEECLRAAEAAPQEQRLHFVLLAQRFFEMGERSARERENAWRRLHRRSGVCCYFAAKPMVTSQFDEPV
jgi:ferritin-like protein